MTATASRPKRSSAYPYGVLWEALVLGDEVEQVAADAELEDEPDVVLRLVPVVELEHVAAVELVQQLHLVQDLAVSPHANQGVSPLRFDSHIHIFRLEWWSKRSHLVHAALGGRLHRDVLDAALSASLVDERVRTTADLIVDAVVLHGQRGGKRERERENSAGAREPRDTRAFVREPLQKILQSRERRFPLKSVVRVTSGAFSSDCI